MTRAGTKGVAKLGARGVTTQELRRLVGERLVVPMQHETLLRGGETRRDRSQAASADKAARESMLIEHEDVFKVLVI